MKASKQVIVVNREAAELQTLSRGLSYLGFDCRLARSASEALQQLAGPAGHEIDLMLVDASVPGEPCVQLVERARVVRPALPVLALTGLATSSEVTALRARGISTLRKPFTPEQLGHAIAPLLLSDTDDRGEK